MGFESDQTAQKFQEELRERFAKFGLALHSDKTRLMEFGRFASGRRRRRGQEGPEAFHFPGLTHCCGTDRPGRLQGIRMNAKKRMRATLAAIGGGTNLCPSLVSG